MRINSIPTFCKTEAALIVVTQITHTSNVSVKCLTDKASRPAALIMDLFSKILESLVNN